MLIEIYVHSHIFLTFFSLRFLGTERIVPHQTYNKTTRSGTVINDLPIFPSDHYGLLIEFNIAEPRRTL